MAKRITNYSEILNEGTKTKSLIDREAMKEMLSKLDILQVLSETYGLVFDQINENKYRGHCPFPSHRDSTPSFDIDIERQNYVCWGCNRRGDLINFFMQMDGISFGQAVNRASEMSGIDIAGFADEGYRAWYGSKLLTDDYINRTTSTELPAGMSSVQFLTLIAKRLKEYEQKVNSDAEETEWVDKVYKAIDYYDDRDDYKELNNIWEKLSQRIKERYKLYEQTNCTSTNP